MKFISYLRNGKPGFGPVVDNKVADWSAHFKDLKSVISQGSSLNSVSSQILEVPGATYDLTDITFQPVIPNPEKIICVGLNYEEHRKETGRPKAEHPAIFVRFADSQVGHEVPVWRPKKSDVLDYEGELAVIIGKSGRYISSQDAMNHVAGFSCYNDVSVRDWQKHTHQFTPGKNFPRTGAFGPWLATPDEISDLKKQTITTRLNGEVMQHASFDMMIFSVPDIIAYVSSFTTLNPGDVIATGTPGGVGFKRDPIVKMKPGDRVEVEISQVGLLRNTIEQEPDGRA